MILSGLLTGLVLLIVSLVLLYASIRLFPVLAEEYYNPVFRSGGSRDGLFYIHPFIVGMALSWFWDRFKAQFAGPGWLKGLEIGLVYGMVAMVPTMWMTFSAIDVSLLMVLTWLTYGVIQAMVAGLILARLNP